MVLDRGAAWTALVDAGPMAGEVRAAFDTAVYVRFGDDVVALVRPEVDPGPVHARVLRLPRATAKDVVLLEGRTVVFRAGAVALPRATWVPPGCGDLRAAGPALAPLGLAPGSLAIGPAASGWPVGFREALADGDVEAACRLVVGRGRGLTPAGDDVAAGILLVHALLGDDPGALGAIAGAAETHEISRSFLRWAARGQAIEPVHHLLAAAVRHDDRLMRSALVRLDQVGHTSGRDTVAGIAVALGMLSECRVDTSVAIHSVR